MPEMADRSFEKSLLRANKTMRSKLQLLSGTDDALPLRDWRSGLPGNWEDASFFRSGLVYDSKVRPGLELPRVNWNAVLGLTLATAVSAGFWAGIGLMIAHLWK
jgi:hypothetical protein